LRGRGLATAAIALGVLGVVFGVIWAVNEFAVSAAPLHGQFR
jgi:hypothetical protein